MLYNPASNIYSRYRYGKLHQCKDGSIMAYIFYIYIFTLYVDTHISLSSVFVHRNLTELYRCLYYVCYTRARNLTLISAQCSSFCFKVWTQDWKSDTENHSCSLLFSSNIKHYHVLRSLHHVNFLAKCIRSSLVGVKMPNWQNSYFSLKNFLVPFALRIHREWAWVLDGNRAYVQSFMCLFSPLFCFLFCPILTLTLTPSLLHLPLFLHHFN